MGKPSWVVTAAQADGQEVTIWMEEEPHLSIQAERPQRPGVT